MSNKLFENFDAVSSKQWKQQIQYELKGADYNDTLVWESPEGIKVKPFYHIDEHNNKNWVSKTNPGFEIGQSIFVFDVEKSIARALDVIKRGAESILFTIADEQISPKQILNALPVENVSVYFKPEFLKEAFIKEIHDFLVENPKTQIYIQLDPIGHLALEGNWFNNLSSDFDFLNQLKSKYTNIHFLSISGKTYQQAGANMVQQIAYILAHCNEYFNRIKNLEGNINIEVAIGTNYFFEIAKIRTIRLLFDLIAKEYTTNLNCKIIVTPTKRNKTLYDYNVNMLRTTTECMSAILGSADVIYNLPYDNLYHKDNEFGDRISRNQLLILKHESYFDKVENAVDGSYYIESLTQQLAEKALQLFKEIEKNDGLITQLIEGTIQRKISESAAKEQELFDSGKEILLGTNKYPNQSDRMKDNLELYPFVKTKPRKTLITPIIEKRLAEVIEKERLDRETN